MKRLALVLVVLAACGGKDKKQTNLAPLPDDKPVAKAEPTPPKPEPEPAKPPPPSGPLDLKIPATTTTVKLVSAGKGKRQPLKLSAKAGQKQAVEVSLDFALKQSMGGQSEDNVVPTVVLSGDAETKAVDPSGTAQYTLTITKTDAKETAGSQVPIDKFKEILATLSGLTIGGTVGPNGSTGEVTMHLDKQAEATGQAVELIRLTLPPWPALPTEPIAPGAKWQATTTTKLADKLDVTQVTDYELVSYKGKVWTIKGKTKVSGADQMMQGGKITKITGTGTSDFTLADGALYPSHKTTLDASFIASEAEPKSNPPAQLEFAIKMGAQIVAK
ncbi:MAG TPA: hypothetical protein VFQ53_32970 [Kofleriaceae bacterium]|nr:hypothetical protein [Kofleriaceae bacterium]